MINPFAKSKPEEIVQAVKVTPIRNKADLNLLFKDPRSKRTRALQRNVRHQAKRNRKDALRKIKRDSIAAFRRHFG